MSSPEQFLVDHQPGSNQNSLLPCSQSLFKKLLQNFPLVVPNVIGYIQSLLGDLTQDLNGVLLKGLTPHLSSDSCYNALGLAPDEICSAGLQFQDIFLPLLQDLTSTDPSATILKRRAALLVESWVDFIPEVPEGNGGSPTVRDNLFRVLVGLMEDADVIVAWSATTALRFYVDHAGFTIESFLEYLPTAFSAVFSLLDRLKEVETKTQVLGFINVVIQQMGDQVAPFAEQLLEKLQGLWAAVVNTQDDHIRILIVRGFTRIVKALGTDSSAFYPVFLPVVAYGIHPDNKATMDSVIEDILSLWKALICNTPQPSTELMELFPNLVWLQRSSVEYVKRIMNIIQAYILIGKSPFLVAYGSDVVQTLLAAARHLSDEGIEMVLKPVEAILLLHPREGGPALEPFFAVIFEQIMTNPQKADTDPQKLSSPLLSQYSYIFGRLLFENAESAMSFFAQYGPESFRAFLDFMFEMDAEVPAVYQQRKAVALGLSHLLFSPEFFDLLPAIINVAVSCLHEGEARRTFERVWEDDDEVTAALVAAGAIRPLSEYDKQLKDLWQADRVRTLSLGSYLSERLTAAEQAFPEPFRQAVQQVDPALLEQLTPTEPPPPLRGPD